jgi:hypothetical protein
MQTAEASMRASGVAASVSTLTFREFAQLKQQMPR